MNDFAIKIANLTKIYPLYNKHIDRLKESLHPLRKKYHHDFYALKDISFEVNKGDIVGIIGRNGSGKSTLLKIITGVLSPSSGNVHVKGRISSLLELGTGFNPDLTGIENIYFNGTINGLSKNEIDKKLEEIIKFADIGEFINQPVKTYSSGMFVRLAFAVAINIDPEILIVDEALSVGDAAFQFKCMERLHNITSKGITMLFVSHDIGTVKSICNKALYLKHGQLVANGTPEDTAELYFMDIRDEQRKNSSDEKRVIRKNSLARDNSIAFGTDEGHIESAKFLNTGSHKSSFMYGENVEIEVEAKYQNALNNPCVSLVIQDRKMLVIAGDRFKLNEKSVNDDWIYSKVIISFRVTLNHGIYHLTLRLENHFNKEQFNLIDKQVGVLQMEVMKSDNTFLGHVNLNMQLAIHQ